MRKRASVPTSDATVTPELTSGAAAPAEALQSTFAFEAPMLKSTAIADAGLTKQTLYEVERHQFSRGTYDRALEALDAVNGEIEGLVRGVWGRG